MDKKKKKSLEKLEGVRRRLFYELEEDFFINRGY